MHDNAADLEQTLAHHHKHHFGVEATVHTDVPGCFFLLGEHTDNYGGVVLLENTIQSAAVALSPRTDDHLELIIIEPVDGQLEQTQQYRQEIIRSTLMPKDAQPVEDSTIATRCVAMVNQLISAQLLARDHHGFSITLLNTIPRGMGLGEDAAAECAIALALTASLPDRDSAPTRAKLADACANNAALFRHQPRVRSRYTQMLRGCSDQVGVVEYLDDSLTQAPIPQGVVPFVVGLDVPVALDTVFAREDFLAQATKAYGVAALRALPDAPARVVDWVSAAIKAERAEGLPSAQDAARWMNFYASETSLAGEVAVLLRSRKHAEALAAISRSQQGLDTAFGSGTAATAIAQLCVLKGASAARATHAGASGFVLAWVPVERAENFAADLLADQLECVALR